MAAPGPELAMGRSEIPRQPPLPDRTRQGPAFMSFMEMIEPVIDHSLTIVNCRASVGDVAHGLIAALKRIRSAVEEVGGYTMVSILDGAIRDRLIIRGLRAVRSGEKEL